ncbi:hypothetical protein BGZ65_010681 [Modicella reniformis]|uniref:Uncharacterized protein n=1 Tax=Modicella reniformis TaxID=1440133 RepID=A0A9P6J3U2_9FUNG|nr:hypothetical protein BGZ65_010681 [Modicella reniformis]
MSFAGPPQETISIQDFYDRAINTPDADTRRRLFADVRVSNPGSYQAWVKSAEVEEHWGAEEAKLKTLLSRGITVFKNPAGSGCITDHDHSQHGLVGPQPITKHTWDSEATAAEKRGKQKTAKALREALEESFQD